MSSQPDFPIFRKYTDHRSFFKIISFDDFIEIKVIGSYYEKITVKAKKYPEKLLIQDLIKAEHPHIQKTTPQAFESVQQEKTNINSKP